MPVINLDGRKVNITDAQLEVLNILDSCQGGGFATVHRYISGTSDPKCITPKVATINFISRFSYKRRNDKLLTALAGVTLADVDTSDPKLSSLPHNDLVDLFNKAKDEVTNSYQKTADGDNSDSYRQGHIRCYVKSNTGVKCHLETENGVVDGKTVKVPTIADNGFPIVKSIMVSVLEIGQTVHEAGEWKATNSQKKTIMKNAIKKVAENGVLPFKMLSLKDNFERLTIDSENITAEDLAKVEEYQEA